MRLKFRYPKLITFDSESVWDGKTGGSATISEGQQIHFDTPETFGGMGQGLCPDELFVSAILGCLNNTFLDFQRRFQIQLVSMNLKGKATVEFDGTGYVITGIAVDGQIVVEEGELRTGKRCVELMEKYCHLTRSIKNCIPIQFDVSHSIGSTGGMGVSFQNRGVSRPVRQRSCQVGRPGNLFSQTHRSH
jgi:organic hydroperoxide reductase OsmC/OhrA